MGFEGTLMKRVEIFDVGEGTCEYVYFYITQLSVLNCHLPKTVFIILLILNEVKSVKQKKSLLLASCFIALSFIISFILS